MLNVTLPVASALGALWLANLHSRKTAEADRKAATEASKEQRRFDARERRHDARREAVISLMDANQDYVLFKGVSEAPSAKEAVQERNTHITRSIYAQSRVSVLCPEEVVRAARELMQASDALPYAPTKASDVQQEGDRFQAALKAYRDACRVMLSEDDRVTNGTLATPST